jgi:hypothetical protein
VRFDEASSKQIFYELEQQNNTTTKVFRWSAWLLSVIGHFLLFSPIIKILGWIPLVGMLLSKILAFAAGIFALIWASMVHILVLGLAWLFYRPIFGICLLVTTGAILFAVFN